MSCGIPLERDVFRAPGVPPGGTTDLANILVAPGWTLLVPRERFELSWGCPRGILSPECPVQVVGEEGLEPSWDCSHAILSRARKPIPPLAHHLYGVN